ncbi:MAG: TetR/AcrR family transcriptional regulator, partial [Bacteroidota bacterium]
VEVFWEHGYQNSSLDMLCDAMGIGRQSLYAWLGDKRQLFIAALRRYEETVTPPLVLEMLDDGARGKASVLELMRWVARQAKVPGSKGCLLTTSIAEFANGDDEILRVVQIQLDLFRRAVEKSIRVAKKEGTVRSTLNVRSTANLMVLLRNGLMLAARSGQADSGVDALVQLVERHLEGD